MIASPAARPSRARSLARGLLPLCALAAPALGRGVPAAAPAGKPLDCLPIVQIRDTAVRDDHTIDFTTVGRKVYRVTLPQPCPQLGFEQQFSYETSLTQLCSTDIITVLIRGPGLMPGASCGLAPFQPVTLTR